MNNHPASVGRLPPHNKEAEQALLGALLLDSRSFSRIEDILNEEDFYNQHHSTIYVAIRSLIEEGTEADLVSLTHKLQRDNLIEKIGGAAYLARLTEIVASSANIRYYAGIVSDCSTRRKLLSLSSRLIEEARDESKESAHILDAAERDIFQMSYSTISYKPIKSKDSASKTYDLIEKRWKNKDTIIGIPSGFPELDKLLNGFHDAEFVIIGARPSIGKTALAVSMIANIAVTNNIACGLFTLEMSDMALMQRLLARQARINANKLRTGFMTTAEMDYLAKSMDPIYDAPLWIVDTPYMRIIDIRAVARRMVLELGIRIIFIDYITLIATDNHDIPRHEQVASISRSLKAMARELNIPIVALSQVTRDSEGRAPNLAHIRESGSLEQDADVVMFLHRERASTSGDSSEHDVDAGSETDLIVAKQRNGPVGTVKLNFVSNYVSFENPSTHSV